MREVTSGSCQRSMANGWMLASAVIAAFAACRIGCAASLPSINAKQTLDTVQAPLGA